MSATERWNEALHHARNAILPETPHLFGPVHENAAQRIESCQPRWLEHSPGRDRSPNDHIMEFIS